MLRRTFAFLCLASLGFLCDRALQAAVFPEREPELKGRVGENLVMAAASPDGTLVAGLQASAPEQWTVTVWETAAGRQRFSGSIPHPPGTTNPLAWSPDGQVLAVGSAGEVNLFEAASGRRHTLSAEWLAREVRFSQDWLLARCDNALFVWNWKTRKLVKRIGQDHLLAAAIDANSGALAAASFQDSVRVYSLPQGKLVQTLPAGPATVGLEFAEKGERLAVAFRFRNDRDRDLAMYYEWRVGRQLARMPEADIVGFSVSSDGSRVLTRNPLGGHLWDPSQRDFLFEFSLPSLQTDSLSPDGKWVASLPSDSGEVVVWPSHGRDQPKPLKHDRPPQRFGFFANGLLQVVDGACSVWKIE